MSTNTLRLFRGEPGLHGPTGPASVSVGDPGPTGPIGPTGAGYQLESGFETYENLNGTVTRTVTFDTPFSSVPTVLTSIQGNINNSNNIRTTVSDVTTTNFNLNVGNNLAQIPATYTLPDDTDSIIHSKQGIINETPAVIHTINPTDRTAAPVLDYVRFNDTEPDILSSSNTPVNIFTDTDKQTTVEIVFTQADPSNNEGTDPQIALIDGKPAILFKDLDNSLVLYSINTSSDGSGEWITVSTGASSGFNLSNLTILDNGNPAFAVIGAGPVIFYYNTQPDGLGVWVDTDLYSIPTTAAFSISISIVDGNPAIAFVDGSFTGFDSVLKYVRASNSTGTIWPSSGSIIELVNQAAPIRFVNLSIVDSNPTLIYADNGNIRYRRSSTINGETLSDWATVISITGPNLSAPSITILGSGHPILSYVNRNNGIVFAATGNGINPTVFSPVVVKPTTAAITNPRTSISLIYGNPCIVSTSISSGFEIIEFFYSLNSNGTSWAGGSRVDPENDTITADLLILNGFPATIYRSTVNTSAKFAVNTIPDGSGTWNIQTIERADVPAESGLYTSVSSINGKPAITSYDDSNNLNYFTSDDIHQFSNSTKVTVTTVGTPRITSLNDVQGNPGIIYYDDASPPALKYAINLDNINDPWTINTIDSTVGIVTYISFSIINEFPAVAYYDSNNTELLFAINDQFDGLGSWTSYTIPQAQIGEFLSLAEVDGRPAISCYDNPGNEVLFIINDQSDGSGTWSIITVDSGLVGVGISLNIINGFPAISYSSIFSTTNKFAINDQIDGTGVWTIYDVLNPSGTEHTILQSVNGKPAIAYYDLNTDIFTYTVNSNSDGSGTWSFFTLDTSSENIDFVGTGVDNQISFEILDENPIIAYKNNNSLNYYGVINVTASDILFLDSSPPAPVVFYSSGSRFEVKIGDDVDGTSFGSAITIDNVSVGNMSALMVDGNPAVSYYSAGKLRYIRSDDTEGTIWSASPVIEPIDGTNGSQSPLEQSQNVGDFNSLAIINNNPAISYYDQTNRQLKYVRSTDTLGDSWDTPEIVDNIGNVGQYTSLAEVNGQSAISYYDVDNQSLKYARFNGATWDIQTIADNVSSPSNNVGKFTSLIISDNVPIVTYYDETNDHLMYTSSSDSNGDVWGEPFILDQNGGQFADLGFTTNSFGISYVNNETNQIKYLSFKLDTFSVNWLAK